MLEHLCVDIEQEFKEALATWVLVQIYTVQWRSLGLFSSEAIHRAQRGEKMLGGSGN